MKSITNLLFLALTLVIGVLIGMSIGGQSSDNKEMVDMDDMDMSDHSHNVKEFEGSLIPEIDITVHDDLKVGWNVEIKTKNFKFAPENASTEDIVGEGHSHIYINGKKISRVYGSWYYLGELPKGENVVTVGLSTNDHGELVLDGEPIADSEIVIVK